MVQERIEQGVYARQHTPAPRRKFLDEAIKITGIGDEDSFTADLHVAQRGIEREDVIQRKRLKHDFFAHAEIADRPRNDLLHICHEITVGEHRSF